MKDEEIEATARLLLNQLFGGFPETALPKLAAALRTARNEAIEEAAKLAECGGGSLLGVSREALDRVTRVIRSLSSHPAGGHDGG